MSTAGTLESVASAFGLAALLFVVTNIDDVFILLALFSSPSFRPSQVVTGQLVGMAILIALSVAGAWLAIAIAPRYIGLLGLVPLVSGIVQLVRDDDDSDASSSAAQSGTLRVMTVVVITVANGGDNIGVYIPIFAAAQRLQVAIYAGTMLAMAAGLCWLAKHLVHHARLQAPIRRFAGPATPFIFIALGLYILVESRAYRVFAHDTTMHAPTCECVVGSLRREVLCKECGSCSGNSSSKECGWSAHTSTV